MTDVTTLTADELDAMTPTVVHHTKYGVVTVKMGWREDGREDGRYRASVAADKLTVNGIEYRASASMVFYVPPLPHGREAGWGLSYSYGGLYLRRLEGTAEPTDAARDAVGKAFVKACRKLDQVNPRARLTAELLHVERGRRRHLIDIDRCWKEAARLEAEAKASLTQVRVLQDLLKKAGKAA